MSKSITMRTYCVYRRKLWQGGLLGIMSLVRTSNHTVSELTMADRTGHLLMNPSFLVRRRRWWWWWWWWWWSWWWWLLKTLILKISKERERERERERVTITVILNETLFVISLRWIAGTHCNISLFHIPSSYRVSVAPFNSIKDGGTLIIEARNILIEGQLDGSGSGYSGGHQTNVNCQGGKQGKSIIGV